MAFGFVTAHIANRNDIDPDNLAIAQEKVIDPMSFRYSKEYDSIAKRQAPIYLGHNRDVFQDEMSKLIATFDKEPVQAFLSDKMQPASLIGADRTCCVVCRQPNAKNRYICMEVGALLKLVRILSISDVVLRAKECAPYVAGSG